ncbi:MAG: polysaccharide deacetylase [Herbinix sp.]|jgi:peptidoglycan/xylan/chitin deacetylase (PgdA/CDA1 family)|nr:polysaccharide deacetylase [Herbinix sp.]
MNRLLIIMYHYVRPLVNSRYPGIKGLEFDMFKQQIEFLKDNFSIITMEEVVAAYNESYDLPDGSVLLTFDDGYMDHFNYVYPILRQHKVQGSFFIPGKTFKEHTVLDVNKIHFSLAKAPIEYLNQELFLLLDFYRGREYDYPLNKELFETYATTESRFDSKEVVFFKRILQHVLPEELRHTITTKIFEELVGVDEHIFSRELYMSYDQVKCMKEDGMFIGSHGYHHYWMNRLEQKELEEDINKGLECLVGLCNPDRLVMNFPYGSYSEEVIDYIDKRGYKLGLSTDVAACTSQSHKLRLPRLDTNDFPPNSRNYHNFYEHMTHGLSNCSASLKSI